VATEWRGVPRGVRRAWGRQGAQPAKAGGGRHSASCRAVRQGRGGGVGCCGPIDVRLAQRKIYFFQKLFNIFELIRSKGDVPVIQNFQIKYGFEYFEIWNNFPYWNFSKFGLEFELKIMEGSRCLI
jgi:hypothetical protein